MTPTATVTWSYDIFDNIMSFQIHLYIKLSGRRKKETVCESKSSKNQFQNNDRKHRAT